MPRPANREHAEPQPGQRIELESPRSLSAAMELGASTTLSVRAVRDRRRTRRGGDRRGEETLCHSDLVLVITPSPLRRAALPVLYEVRGMPYQHIDYGHHSN